MKRLFFIACFIAWPGPHAGADEVQVHVKKTNMYIADEFYLEFVIKRERTENILLATEDLIAASDEAVAAIRDAGIDILALETSFVYPDLTRPYSEISEQIKNPAILSKRHRVILGTHSDLVLAYAVISHLNGEGEEIKLSIGSRMTEEAELVRQTLRDASEQVMEKANELAEQNDMVIGPMLYIQIRGSEISDGLENIGPKGEARSLPYDSAQDDEGRLTWFSDKIHVEVALTAIFEWQTQNAE